MASEKKIVIVGAGPGGLTAGMMLAHRGFHVTIYEKESQVGGRNGSLDFDGFSFDIGPTFLMMKFILDEVFEEAGYKADDRIAFTRLDPMYRLYFADGAIDMVDDDTRMREEIARRFPGDEAGFDRFMTREKVRYDRMYPCLQKSYDKFLTLFHPDFLKALPHLSLGHTMFQELGQYYTHDKLKIGFTFQSKYLGMSPWSCPAAFMIIPYIEHAQGVWHVRGGLSEISRAMAKVVTENGGTIHLQTPVERLITEGRTVKGVQLRNGEKVPADTVIMNADFAYAMTELVTPGTLKKYSRASFNRRLFSCSTYMLYLGVDKVYDLPHHSIVFSRDYNKYISDVADHRNVADDLSVYVRNASVTDPTLAPEGKSNIYCLVPVSNNRAGKDWKADGKFRETVLRTIMERTEMKDLDRHIVAERVLTPNDWQEKYNVFLGATFNLGHTLTQMLYFRPHNKFEELENCWLVGGGTHPGSGLPTIYESGRITANLISRHYQVPFISRNLQIK